jgi:peptidoglycan/LPS O-acetylase OafA/YrhL
MAARTDLTSVRLMLASAVIASHCNMLEKTGAEPSFLGLGLGGWALMGFFFLSGALISTSWRTQPDLRRFVKHRALRILPGFAAAFCVCALIIAPLFGAAPTLADLWDFLTLGAPHVAPFKGVPVDAPLYTIRWEIICYAAVPLFYRPLSRAPTVACAILALFIGLALIFPQFSLYRLFAAFLGGALMSAIKIPRLPLPKIPDISFGTYLYGWPIQGMLISAGVRDPWLLLATALPLALFAGWLSFQLVERPAMAHARRAVPTLSILPPVVSATVD